jgi:hypothetical protein
LKVVNDSQYIKMYGVHVVLYLCVIKVNISILYLDSKTEDDLQYILET